MVKMKTAPSGAAPALSRPFRPMLLLLGAVLLVPPAAAAAVDVPGAGGVVLNGEKIGVDQVWDEYSYQNSVRRFVHSRAVDAVDENLLSSVIEQQIRKRLLLHEAGRLGFTLEKGDAEKVRQKQVESWKGEQNFQNALRMIGVEERFILNRSEETLLIRRMLGAASKSEEGITEEVLLEHYRANPGRYLAGELPPLRYIFIPREVNSKQDGYRLVRLDIDALRQEGKIYAPLAARYSKHESAAAGGITAPGSRPPSSAGGVKECRLSPKRVDSTGVHLYFRDCRQPLPFADVQEKVREDLLAERRKEYGNELIERLRGEAEVIYLPLEGPPPLGENAGHTP